MKHTPQLCLAKCGQRSNVFCSVNSNEAATANVAKESGCAREII